MYQAMKDAIRHRKGRGVHELVNNLSNEDEPREALGLAPEASSDVSSPDHLHNSPALHALMENARNNPNQEFQAHDESMELQGHNMSHPSAEEEMDETGNTDKMSHSDKTLDTAHAGSHARHGEVSHGLHRHEHDKMHGDTSEVETSRDAAPMTGNMHGHGPKSKSSKVQTSHEKKFRSIKEAAGEARKRGM